MRFHKSTDKAGMVKNHHHHASWVRSWWTCFGLL